MAGIIRQEQVAAARTFSFADLEKQGREAVRLARDQAAAILQEARRQSVALAQQAEQEGHTRGLAEGRAEGEKQARKETHATAVKEARAQVAALVEALRAAVGEFEQSKRRLLAVAESGLIDLALAIARRVCKLEAGASTDTAVGNARQLLEMVQHTGDAELRVHPREHEGLQELAADFLEETGRLGHVRIVPDESVSAGGCVLTTPTGEIDARIETQLDRIAAALRVTEAAAKVEEPGDRESC
ncbi:MAG: FliH/SctL family protein [Phycisphaerae bacterium]